MGHAPLRSTPPLHPRDRGGAPARLSKLAGALGALAALACLALPMAPAAAGGQANPGPPQRPARHPDHGGETLAQLDLREIFCHP